MKNCLILMNEINNLLEFLYENINDERIEVSRKIKYGFKYYFISVRIDIDSKSGYKTYNVIQLTIDNRNKCIELEVNMDAIVLENDDLVIKWSNILEEHLNDRLEDDLSHKGVHPLILIGTLSFFSVILLYYFAPEDNSVSLPSPYAGRYMWTPLIPFLITISISAFCFTSIGCCSICSPSKL